MTKELKKFKLYKLKQNIKKNNIVFFFHTTNLKTINWLKIEKELFNSQLKCHKINNTLTNYAFKNSNFSNFSSLINGELCFIYLNNLKYELNIQKLIKPTKTMQILGIKLNQKFYSKPQLTTISTLNYNTNIKIFNKILKKILKLPYYKFKN